MPASAFAYAVVRVVPSVERGEFINAGVVLFARQHDFLAAKVRLDRERLDALAPEADARAIEEALEHFERIAAGDDTAGPIAALEKSERFGWLVAPASTVVQCSPVHTGITEDPARSLTDLFTRLAT